MWARGAPSGARREASGFWPKTPAETENQALTAEKDLNWIEDLLTEDRLKRRSRSGEESRVGEVIGGKWRVDSLLGAGSMASVYAVTHRNGARSALKILHAVLATDPATCARFLGEGHLTNSVKHSGIVRVIDDGVTEDGATFLVMDLLQGRTLEVLRQERGGQIGLGEILDLADKLMDVLHAVHEAGVIHRDLKPQNVFVCDDGSIKLLDFGVARVADSRAQSELSALGLVLGTPSFMSPEQAVGARDQIDHRTDIWSLGATLFNAITGQTVHLGPNMQARLIAATKMKARPIAMAKHDVPEPIAAAIDKALRFKKEDRWASVDAFRHALRDARPQLGLAAPEPAAAPPPSWLQSQEAPALPPELLVNEENSAELLAPEELESVPELPPMRPRFGSALEVGYAAYTSEIIEIEKSERSAGSSVGFWVTVFALIAGTTSGVAYFAVNQASAMTTPPSERVTTPEASTEEASSSTSGPTPSDVLSGVQSVGFSGRIEAATPPPIARPAPARVVVWQPLPAPRGARLVMTR